MSTLAELSPNLKASGAAVLDADELADLAAEDARAEWREQMAELALHNRAYRDGDWDLDDFLEWSPVGRGEAAAFARRLSAFAASPDIPPTGRLNPRAFEACAGQGGVL